MRERRGGGRRRECERQKIERSVHKRETQYTTIIMHILVTRPSVYYVMLHNMLTEV